MIRSSRALTQIISLDLFGIFSGATARSISRNSAHLVLHYTDGRMERNDIVCSHSASVRLDMALRWVVSRLSRSEILVIGATRAAADEFARHISGPGSLGLHCLSLTQIASALALL